jgi:hypothetical protein
MILTWPCCACAAKGSKATAVASKCFFIETPNKLSDLSGSHFTPIDAFCLLGKTPSLRQINNTLSYQIFK